MTTPQDNLLLKPPQYPSDQQAIPAPKGRVASTFGQNARANLSLSSLFASTSPSLAPSRESTRTTPLSSPLTGPTFPTSPNDEIQGGPPSRPERAHGVRGIIMRAIVPHVGVVASADTEQMLMQKGFKGGFLDLIRPFGQHIQGKVVIRDSVGVSKPYDDFGVRFDSMRGSSEPASVAGDIEGFKPVQDPSQFPGSHPNATMRTNGLTAGGNVAHIEELVDQHLSYAEAQSPLPGAAALIGHGPGMQSEEATTPFFNLYMRKMLSELPLVAHETFSHPVACVIAISSRSPSPIEELRRLYASTNTGDDRTPLFVNNEFLRYYVLVHDEDQDDIGKSTSLYEQMKRHFGLHCHLLRLRSNQCVSSDDDCVQLPVDDTRSAAEDLSEIRRRETLGDLDDPTACVFESDATAIRTFVRELVTQSIVPSMERACATWNEQVATRRRGISGKLMSFSKRFSPFGSSSRSTSSPVGSQGGSGSNYDAVQGFYKPDAPEALLRKLGDYAFMLRDFRLAQSTYDLARADFESDKAWKYYAAASEMTVISTLMTQSAVITSSAKARLENTDRLLEAATHSYIHRSYDPFYALRTLILSSELLKVREAPAPEDAARWASRILDYGLVGPIGNVLVTTRISSCYRSISGIGALKYGSRRRKESFWSLMAADGFMGLGKTMQATQSLTLASKFYSSDGDEWSNVKFGGMRIFLKDLQGEIRDAAHEKREAVTGESITRDHATASMKPEVEDAVEEIAEQLDPRPHRQSLIGAPVPMLGSVDVAPLSPVKFRDRGILEDAEEEIQ